VHAVLADRGITPPPLSLWATPGRTWLAALELPPTPRAIIEDCWGVLDTLARPIARLEGEIAALAKPDPGVQALMALPGVGKLTAMTLLAECGPGAHRLIPVHPDRRREHRRAHRRQ
jgi:transposase